MKGKKKWIVIGVIVLLLIFGALGGKNSDKAPKDNGYTSQAESAEVAEQEEEATEEQTEDEQAEEAAETTEPEEEQTSDVPEGVSPELVEFLDSYEAFMDEYCEFMKNYNESDPTQLLKYASIMEKYYEFSEKAEAWDEEEMTDEETLYYLKVMNRVNEKLLETEAAMG